MTLTAEAIREGQEDEIVGDFSITPELGGKIHRHVHSVAETEHPVDHELLAKTLPHPKSKEERVGINPKDPLDVHPQLM